MANDPLTLITAANMLPDSFAQGMVELFASGNAITREFPIDVSENPTLYQYQREKYIADAHFRKYNSSVDISHSHYEDASEPLFPLSSYIQIDNALKKGNGNRVEEIQIAGAMKGINSKLSVTIFDGDASVGNEFDGLNIRLTNYGQVHPFGINVLANAANAKIFLDQIYLATASVDEPSNEGKKVWLMSKTMKVVLNNAISLSGYYMRTDKNVETGFETFADYDIILVDRDKDGNEILGFDEGIGLDEGSIYLMILSKTDGIHLVVSGSNGTIDPTALDEGSRGGIDYYFFELLVGLAMKKKRSGFRLDGIKKA